MPNVSSAEKPCRKFGGLLFLIGLLIVFKCDVEHSAMQIVIHVAWFFLVC